MSMTYYVVCLHEPCSQEAANFIAECLSKALVKGGAELIVKQETLKEGHGGLVLHVSASKERLYQLAEDMELKKTDGQGIIRPFKRNEASNFQHSGFVGPLTLAEVHKCVLYAMELVHFDEEQTKLPGHHGYKLMKKAPVLSSYQDAGLVDIFPLHDDDTLKKLYGEWSKSSILDPPIDSIRDYFGENVALYVSFTSFYTKFLIPMAILGILHYCLDHFLGLDFIYNNLIFACVNLVAVTVFLEFWKRRSNAHAFHYGTSGKLRNKRPRPAFRGDYGLNPVTGKPEVQYPFSKTLRKILFVSVPVTLGCLCLAFILMLLSFEAEKFMVSLGSDDLLSQALAYIPSVVYSIVVLMMNMKYLQLAHHLTEWENHRTQEQFESHVVAKLVLFEFVNTFLALFYIAFYLQDIPMLKSQLFTMLIVTQLVNQVQETILPVLLRRPSSRRLMHKIAKKVHHGANCIPCSHKQVETIDCLDERDGQVLHALFSLQRDPYESTYDDFMELWLQFGHVFLFSSVYPLATCFALINNLFELRMDGFKLCRLMRKPTPRGVRDIGAWYMAFSITSIISVMTNLTLLAMDTDVQAFAPEATDRDWILLFVAIEHIFLAIRVAIDKLIPDVSKDIKIAIDRNDFALRDRFE